MEMSFNQSANKQAKKSQSTKINKFIKARFTSKHRIGVKTGVFELKNGKKQELCFILELSNSTGTRHYVTPQLNNPDFNTWSDNEQMFVAGLNASDEIRHKAQTNNKALNDLLETLKQIADNNNITTSKELKAAYTKFLQKTEPTESKKTFTLLEYVNRHIEKLIADNCNTNPNANIKKSTNYQVYRNFANKLLTQKNKTDYPHFANIPINEINNNVYIKWCDYVSKELPHANFTNMTKYFKSIYNKARADENLNMGNFPPFTYDCKKSLTIKRNKKGTIAEHKNNKIENCLSESDFKAFLEYPQLFELDDEERLFFDTALLSYLLMTRPKDIVLMNWDDITTDGEKWIWEYCPYKFRNKPNQDKMCVQFPIDNKLAQEIMLKYKNHKGIIGNYVLPLKCNLQEKDYIKNFKQFENLTKKTIEKLNQYLKIIDKRLNDIGKWNTKHNLTNYTFRHSVITHLVQRGANDSLISLFAGTSPTMLRNYYIGKKTIAKTTSIQSYMNLNN